jgi:hypothetical protein
MCARMIDASPALGDRSPIGANTYTKPVRLGGHSALEWGQSFIPIWIQAGTLSPAGSRAIFARKIRRQNDMRPRISSEAAL